VDRRCEDGASNKQQQHVSVSSFGTTLSRPPPRAQENQATEGPPQARSKGRYPWQLRSSTRDFNLDLDLEMDGYVRDFVRDWIGFDR